MYDAESQVETFGFSEPSVRSGFIRKVYSILVCQLSITVAVISLFLYHEPTRNYVQQSPKLCLGAAIVTFVLIIVIACCGNVRRKSPLNYILLSIFTIAESVTLGVFASFYSREEVLMALIMTTVVCLGLTIFALQTNIDFTGMGTILFVGLLILITAMIIFIFTGMSKLASILYSSFAVFLFSLFLIYDTQLMIGGKHKNSISPEEYIFAALSLYLDIVIMFMHILRLIGGGGSD